MTMQLWLTVWGILALVALMLPGVVAVGTFFLLPGLILVAAPTIFLYSGVFALLRRFLPFPPGLVLNVTAVLFALLLGWLIAQPGAIAGRRAFKRANLPEVVPNTPVKLAGHIRLESPRRSASLKHDPLSCGALCAALLDTPSVESVTLATTGQPTEAALIAFRLIPRGDDRSRGAYPVTPEAILSELPPEPETNGHRDFEAQRVAKNREGQSVAAAWALRLASRQKLVAEQAKKADMTVRITEDRRNQKDVSIARVEILDHNGKTLMRRSIVTGSALAAPLYFGITGSIENLRVELARERLSNGPEYPGLKPVTELFRHSSLARPKVDSGAMTALLDRLRSATANPSLAGDDPDLGLAELWLPTIDWQRPISADQLAVLGCVISDERIAIPRKLYDGYESKVALELRSALGSRVRKASTPPETRTQLARLLSKMPQGTFATLSADEKAFLESDELRPDAYPMIVRMADRGEAAVPDLLAIVRRDRMLKPANRRIAVMHAASLGFATLGPKAHAALPEIDALVNANPSTLSNSWGDRKRWYLALARMGKPLDEFNWYNSKPDANARDREALRRRVERFDPEEVWNY